MPGYERLRRLAPHFEKMLYDNTLLALAYMEAFQHIHRPLYEQVVRRTLDYVLRELSAPQGGFCCGQDADSGGVEGAYYVLPPDELAQVLGKSDSEHFCKWYNITQTDNFEGKSIPNLLEQTGFDREPERMAALRKRICVYRLGWRLLHRDDKVLTAWNGLVMAALAKAGLMLDESRLSQSRLRVVFAVLSRRRAGGSGHSPSGWQRN